MFKLKLLSNNINTYLFIIIYSPVWCPRQKNRIVPLHSSMDVVKGD
jgi:hypothetical protein